MSGVLEIRPRVEAALAAGRGVVALESTVIAHGLPAPRGVEVALEMEAAVAAAGAEPATIGLLDSRAVVGLEHAEIEQLADRADVAKVSLRDLGAVVAGGGAGATTVAATVALAAQAGLRVMATGGLGGVHRGGEASLDVSADITALGRYPLAVVCSGAKAILDLPRTLEALETAGVAVVGYRSDEFPAFYARSSGLELDHRVDDGEAAARLLGAHWRLGQRGVVVTQPPPASHAWPQPELEDLIAAALDQAAAKGVSGRALTPFLLDAMARASGGRTVDVNVALLVENARLAGRLATAWARIEG